MRFLNVVALDLDGTVSIDGSPHPDTMDAIDAARLSGLTVILATGRIQAELEAEFPGLTDHFDALVLENGAVVVSGGRARALTPPLDPGLDQLLDERGVPFRRGKVLRALDGAFAPEAVRAVNELGLDHQVVHNRGAAMVLPAGVTKGTGLVAVLADARRSPHNAIGVGDAENDLALLDAAEVGIAVPDSVPSLLRRADVVLERGPGNGIPALLRSDLLDGTASLCPTRHWVAVGFFDDDRAARVPGSQATVLVSGPPCSGKSYLAGLLAEQWMSAGYVVLVIDPEGDHAVLAELPNVQLVEMSPNGPEPVELLTTLTQALDSVVLDLSSLAPPARAEYVRRLLPATEAARVAYGLPHWVILDEAHLGGDPSGTPVRPVFGPGYVLASYQLDQISHLIREDEPATVLVTHPPEQALGAMAPRRATLTSPTERERPFTVGQRRTAHVRHEHKYITQPLPSDRRFYFRTLSGKPLVASTIPEFRTAIRKCETESLGFHIDRGDLSRWVTEILADAELGTQLARIELAVSEDHVRSLERARQKMLRAITERYLDHGHPRA